MDAAPTIDAVCIPLWAVMADVGPCLAHWRIEAVFPDDAGHTYATAPGATATGDVQGAGEADHGTNKDQAGHCLTLIFLARRHKRPVHVPLPALPDSQ